MNWLLLFSQTITPDEIDIPGNDLDGSEVPAILGIVFPIIGLITLIIMVLAGFKYVRSHGNPGETAKAKNTIIFALVGLVITMISYSIVAFVVQAV